MTLTLESIIPFAAALVSAGLGLFVLIRDRRSRVNQSFAVGMMVLAAETLLGNLCARSLVPAEVLYWQHLKSFASALLPGSWLLFSLTYARQSGRKISAGRRLPLLSAFVLPLLPPIIWADRFFAGTALYTGIYRWAIPLGWSGIAFYMLLLVALVFVLMNLERTLRASSGRARWQVKMLIVGLACYFAFRTYDVSQILMFRSVDTGLRLVDAGILQAADFLVICSLLRGRLSAGNLYLSETSLHNSLTLVVVGVYLLLVGLVGKLMYHLDYPQSIGFVTFFVFLAVIGLAVLLLSDRARLKTKQFAVRHFHRPQHDYRKVWSSFTQKTASLVEPAGLCHAAARMTAQTLDVLSVSIWLVGSRQESSLEFGGSTLAETAQGSLKGFSGECGRELVDLLQNYREMFDLDYPYSDRRHDFKEAHGDSLREARVRLCCPLIAGDRLVGIMTIGDRVSHLPFSLEDMELLQTVCDQMAASLLNLQMIAELQQARQFEMLCMLSSFLVHDLKNVASTLALTVQNLPVHYENPEFREDAVKSLVQGVGKINGICRQLAELKDEPVYNFRESDLDRLAAETAGALHGCLKGRLSQTLEARTRLLIDREQIQKVLTNLILNANDAIDEGGEIEVKTYRAGESACICVSDNGRGMSEDFVQTSFFKPFKTTKKGGMGIGLYQCKMIVEAHGGRIEVESKEGKGSTFRVVFRVHESRESN